jgi:hypothetical protein
VSRFVLLSTRARDSIVLRSDFVEAMQHFAARPQYCNTQREDQKGGHFSIPPSSRGKLRGGFSVDEFSVELTDAVAPVVVFPEFCLCDAAESSLSRVSVVIRSGRPVQHEAVFWSRGMA